MNNRYEAGALILRLVVGIAFFIHGLAKFQGGIENIVGWFGSIGLPGFLAYIIAIIELGGGIVMILGIGTRVVGILFAVVLLGAIVKVKAAAGFMGNGQMAGYELDLALLAMSLYLGMTGSQMLSLEKLVFRSKQKQLA